MRRRDFIAVAVGVTSFPGVALTQAATKRLAFINSVAQSDPAMPAFLAAAKQGLAAQGWVEGRNLDVRYWFAVNVAEAAAGVAAAAIDLRPDVILSVGNVATHPGRRHWVRACGIGATRRSETGGRGFGGNFRSTTMSLDLLRTIVGASILSSHLLFLLLIATTDSVTSTERLDLSLLAGPTFALYGTIIFRSMLSAMREKWDPSPIHPAFAGAAVAFALIFSAALPTTFLFFTQGRIANFAGLKTSLGAVETCLGLYTGMLVEALFGKNEKSKRTPRSRPRRGDTEVSARPPER